MNTTRIRKKPKSHYWVFIFITLAGFIAEFCYKKYACSFVDDYALKTQMILRKIPYMNYAFRLYSLCDRIKLMPIILIGFVYNFGNIYKILILIFSLQITLMYLGIMKICFQGNRPFWYLNNIIKREVNFMSIDDITTLNNNNVKNDENLIFFAFENGFGNPAHDITVSTVMLFSTWRMIFHSKKWKERSRIWKYLLFLIILSFISGYSLFKWCFFTNSSSQILFSFFISASIYVLIFHVFNLFSNNIKQIRRIVDFPMYYKILICMGITTGYLVMYFTIKNYDSDAIKIDPIIQSKIVTIPKTFRVEDPYLESFISFSFIYIYFGIFSAISHELYSHFEGNFNNWSQYNFEQEEEKDDSEEESLLTKLSTSRQIQWNHTSLLKSVFRMVLLLILLFISASGFFFVSFDSNIILVFLVKILLPLNIVSFGMFYGYKQLLKYCKVTNITIFIMIRESI